MITLNCKVCEKKFKVKPYRKNIALYCSQKCSWTSKARLDKVRSKLKGRIVNPKTLFQKGHKLLGSGLVEWRANGGTPWNKKPNFFIDCLKCGKNKQIKPAEIGRAKFCSKECVNKYRDMGKTPLAKKIRESLEYEEWRKQVFERDLYTCQDCGQIGGFLNADHVIPFAFYPELRFELSNGRTLCRDCHRKTDTFGAKAWRTRKETSKWRCLASV